MPERIKQRTTWYQQASFSSYCLYVMRIEHFMISEAYSEPCQTTKMECMLQKWVTDESRNAPS